MKVCYVADLHFMDAKWGALARCPVIPSDQNRGAVNRLYRGDALSVTKSLLTRGERFDLIYMDPPFGTKRTFRASAGSYQDLEVEALLNLLYPVLENTRALLTKQGSLIVHLDYRAVWAVKLVLDQLFGVNRFQNQLIWMYQSGGRAKKRYSRKHDVLLWYSRGARPYFDSQVASLPKGKCERCGAKRAGSHLKTVVSESGKVLKAIKSNGKMYYYDADAQQVLSDVWLDIGHLHQLDPERIGYPTQKPLKLLRRLVGAHAPPGGRVLDPFAGSGTTLIAAGEAGRPFLGCDPNPEAVEVIVGRCKTSGIPVSLVEPL